MKKILSSILIICSLFLLILPITINAEETNPPGIIGPPIYWYPGDANNNGEVTITDAILILRAALGLISFDSDSQEFYNADVNQNNIIDTVDALWTLRCAMGIHN